jgi:CspA family cold shock protein
MFAAARHLLLPKGVVKAVPSKFAILQFTEGGTTKTALLLPPSAVPGLVGRGVSFKVGPSTTDASKFQALEVRLCDAASASGNIKFYDPLKGFGFVTATDGRELFVHHSQVADFGQSPAILKRGDIIEFDVHLHEKGPRASHVRRAA